MNDVVFRGVNYVYDNELEREKDFIHQRRSGLNHVLIKQFLEKNIEVLFSYSNLINASNKRKSQILGRIMQNIKLCNKHKVKYSFVCLGNESILLRSPQDVAALDRLCK